MLRKLLFLSFFIVVLACQQEEPITMQSPTADITVRDGRLVFSSEELYAEKMSELEKLSPQEQTAWLGQFKFNPLVNMIRKASNQDLFIEKQKMTNMTPGHFLVLNEGRVIQFGEDVVFFGEDIKYYMNVDEYNKLSNKGHIVQTARTGRYVTQALSDRLDESGRLYFDAWNKGDIGVGGHQWTFAYNGQKKFVVEWYVKMETVGTTRNCGGDPMLRSTLYLRTKLEEKINNTWWSSGVYRSTRRNLTWDNVKFFYGANLCTYYDKTMWFYPTPQNSGLPSYSNSSEWFQVAVAGPMYMEWRATVDLKKWEGYATGWVSMQIDPDNNGFAKTFNF